jgi:hypothetical protein
MYRFVRGLPFALLLAACAHTSETQEKKVDETQPEQQVLVADKPGLKVLSEPDDAELVIDGQSYGKVAALPGALSLKPGIYQVSLKRGGYATWRAEVAVGDKTEQLHVVLVKQQ